MKRSYCTSLVSSLLVIVPLSLVIAVHEAQSQMPPVGAPIVREGAFAMKLAEAFSLGQASSEAEAESLLGGAGIAPRNGWIADYPVTPDIIGELRDSIAYAAQAKTISMDKDTALKILEDVQAGANLSVSPGPAGPPEASSEGTSAASPAGESAYPDQTVINSYYYDAGPPIVTYYPPPPDYYYLYAWVPYPFWWSGFWFGGFFILHDFHHHYREHGRPYVVSNHFRDARANKVFRIDPLKRFNGRTFAGIGAPRSNTFVNPGVRRAPERVFNGGPASSPAPSYRTRTVRPQGAAPGSAAQAPTRSYRTVNPFEAQRVYSSPPGGGRTYTPRSGTSGGGKTYSAPAGRVGGSVGRQSSQPAGRERTSRPPGR